MSRPGGQRRAGFLRAGFAASTGTTVYRRADKLDRDDDTLAGTTSALPRAMFVRTHLTWRLPGS